MKNRRTALIAFVLIAALCMGVGYAVLTDQLAINGSVAYEPSELDENIYFSNATAPMYHGANGSVIDLSTIAEPITVTALNGVEIVADSDNGDTLEIEIPVSVLLEAGDYITFNATVKYEPQDGVHSSATLGAPVVTSDNDAFDVKAEYANGAENVTLSNDDGLTADITVTITMETLPTDKVEQTFTISIPVTGSN